MVKMNKIVILTGMSGAGKTEILHQMKDAYYKNNDYFLEWGESACNQQKRIVILDQFERALTMSN